MDFQVFVAGPSHFPFAQEICDLIEESAKARGTGIAKRKPEYICQKMEEGKAIIALQDNQLAGFCYIETWGHGQYVANSGLIVNPVFRQSGLARAIKQKAFELSRTKYPEAKIFGITTSLAVMKINSDLGYKPVTFSELTDDETFWNGCQSCPNFDVLTRTSRKMCLCTGMLYDPAWDKKEQPAEPAEKPLTRAEQRELRWQKFLEHLRSRRANPMLQKILEGLFQRRDFFLRKPAPQPKAPVRA
ncbi:MAG: GNAT family N-acetyltransferase [Bacteroidia bacterium]|nr:GNAT family N-acetyltransferase [Bacteroidia bacterium]